MAKFLDILTYILSNFYHFVKGYLGVSQTNDLGYLGGSALNGVLMGTQLYRCAAKLRQMSGL
jgi:hypothetical protein